MIPAKGYAAHQVRSSLKPFQFERRSPGPQDVLINIHYCGICHSDIHKVRDEWGGSRFPMVPGHEIVGIVEQVGDSVKNFKVGDAVGVGCMVDSCSSCNSCKEGLEQYCNGGTVFTYDSFEKNGKTLTYGGYSNIIVVKEEFVLSIPPEIPLAQAAPLLCAGITTYSPLRHWKVSPGQRLAVVGLGGLGHMAVKIAAAMGAEVSVLSTSEKKKDDALRFGAKRLINTTNKSNLSSLAGYFDLIINTVSSNQDLSQLLNLLALNGTMVLVGVPEAPAAVPAFSLIGNRRSLAGSLIGGIKETQEMLNFCAAHGIASDIELIRIDEVNQAYERMLKSDVRYRFVIDLKSLD